MVDFYLPGKGPNPYVALIGLAYLSKKREEERDRLKRL